MDAIKQQGLSIDLIVATGDLVQDQSFAAYQHFADGLQDYLHLIVVTCNHDYQPAMIDALNQAGILSAKQVLMNIGGLLLLG